MSMEQRRSPAYQLTAASNTQQQQTLVNTLNASNLKRKHNTLLAQTEPSKDIASSSQCQTKSDPPEKPRTPTATTTTTAVAQHHPFVRYTDAITQRLVLQHPEAVEFWARCPLCHIMICCIDQKTSCYRSDAVVKHVQSLHTEGVWITSNKVNAEFMWGACNPICGGFDQLSMFVDDLPDRSASNPDDEAKSDTTPEEKVEKDVLNAIALEAKTQFRFTTPQDTPSSSNKRRRIIVPQCVAGSTAHPRTKCTQACYLEMIG
ncbi:hypothetical protein Unana1_08428 [Umbelopsis nana]